MSHLYWHRGRSEKVMEIMEECMLARDMNFNFISQVTSKDYYTYTHSVNVGLYCMTFGVKSRMGRNDIHDLGLGGMLHDVGKSKVPHEILNKNGGLTDKEFGVIKRHSFWGEEILNGMDCYKSNVVSMAGQHHEKFEGGGYHRQLARQEISFYARVCKIMDVYDALTSCRTYKKPLEPFDALSLMKHNMNDHFDPALLASFIHLMGPDA